jgi:prophage antirepressor-like protein
MNDSTNIIPFNFDCHPLRAVVLDGQLWLHAGDICAALDLSNTTVALEIISERYKAKHCLGLPGSAPWLPSPAPTS